MALLLCNYNYNFYLFLYLFLSISSFVVFPLCFVLLSLHRNYNNNKGMWLFSAGALGSFIYAQAGLGQIVFGNFPCWLHSLLIVFVVPLVGGINLLLKAVQSTQNNDVPYWGCGVLFACTFLPFIIVFGVVMPKQQLDVKTCTGKCEVYLEEIIVICVMCALIFICTIATTCRARDKWELTFMCVFGALALTGVLLDKYSPSTDAVYDHDCLTVLGLWLFLAVQIVAFAVQKEEEEETKPLQESRSSMFIPSSPHTSDRLTRVLSNSKLSKAFEQFLIQESSEESLWFLQATDKWKFAFASQSANERLFQARAIVNQYVCPGAEREINIESKYLSAIISVMDDPSTVEVYIDLFDVARQQVEDLLQYGSFARFQDETSIQLV